MLEVALITWVLNQDKRALFLISTSYPYGHLEPLLHYEVKRFCERYEQIVIFCSSTEDELKYELPHKVHVIPFSNELSLWEKIKGSASFFSKACRAERKQIKAMSGVNPSLAHHKILLNSFALMQKFQKIASPIEKKFREFQIDYYSYWCDEPIMSSAILSSKNVVSRMHGYDLYTERHKPAYLPFRKAFHDSARKILFISNQGKNYFKSKYKVNEDKLQTLYLGVTNCFQTPPRNKDSRINLISCSSIIPLKRIQLIADLVKVIGASTVVNWIHIGDGSEREKIIAHCRRELEGNNNISYAFLGEMSPAMVMKHYQENFYDFFVNLSETEGLPISIMEANSFQIPAVATNVGGVSEIVSENSGILVDLNPNINHLALKLRELFTDQTEYQRMRKTAYEKWLHYFNGEKNTDKLIEALSNQ